MGISSARAALIESDATELLRNAHAWGSPVDLKRVCSWLNVTVHFETLEDSVSGVLVIRGGERHALVNASHHANRQRFSLAHELGHLLLHDSRGDRLFIDTHMRMYQRVGAPSAESYTDPESLTTPDEEREANIFASALLMPRQLIQQCQHLDLSEESEVTRLARSFAVSDQAMSIRLQQLGLVRIAAY